MTYNKSCRDTETKLQSIEKRVSRLMNVTVNLLYVTGEPDDWLCYSDIPKNFLSTKITRDTNDESTGIPGSSVVAVSVG